MAKPLNSGGPWTGAFILTVSKLISDLKRDKRNMLDTLSINSMREITTDTTNKSSLNSTLIVKYQKYHGLPIKVGISVVLNFYCFVMNVYDPFKFLSFYVQVICSIFIFKVIFVEFFFIFSIIHQVIFVKCICLF